MLGTLTKSIKYTHISLLKKYDLKSHYRYKQADKYIADHKFEKIKTYKDLMIYPEEIDNIQLTLSEEDEQQLREIYVYERKQTAWTK